MPERIEVIAVAQLGLSDSDVRAMLHAASYGPADADGGALPLPLLRELRDLVPCNVLFVSGQDDAHQTSFDDQGVGEKTPCLLPDEVYWHYYWDCLHASYTGRTGDLESVTMTSDFYSDRQLLESRMYVEYSRTMSEERQITVCLPAGHSRTLRLLFVRASGADFTERDRAVLTLLRPHLLATYTAVERQRRAPDLLTQRQRQIVTFVAAGYTNRQIGNRLHLSEGTVRKHLENTFARLGVTSRSAAVARVGADAFVPQQVQRVGAG